MLNYKGFDIEEIQNGRLICRFSDKYGDNRIFNDMEDLKVNVDEKILRDEKNKLFNEQQNLKIEEEKRQIALKETNLNAYLSTIKTEILKGKIRKTLNFQISYKGLIMAKYQYLESRKEEVLRQEITEKPLYIFNRLKFNKMDNEKEQNAYTEKCNIKTLSYMALVSENMGFELNKTEYDYLKFLRGLKCL